MVLNDILCTPCSDDFIGSVLHAADDVLKTVSEAGTKTSDQADEKLKWVAEVLHGYEADWCSRFSGSSGLNIKERMATAKAKDGSTLSFLNLLKEKLRAQVRFR